MDNLADFIEYIENNYEVQKISYRNVSLWPILRIPYAFAYRSKLFDTTKDKFYGQSSQNPKGGTIIFNKIADKVKSLNVVSRRSLIKSLKSHDYIAISSFSNKRNLHNRTFDIFVGDIVDILGSDKVLELDILPYGREDSDDIIPLEAIDVLISILRRFYLIRKEHIINYHLLDELNSRFGITVPYIDITKNFWSYYKLFKNLLKLWKARCLFVVCYYCVPNNYIIYAARKAGLTVVEVQHGIINNQHPAYNIFVNIDKDFLPHYLLSFGEIYEKMIKNSFYAKVVNMIPIGHYYLEWIKNQYTTPLEISVIFDRLRKKYKKIIAVTSQTIVSEFLIEFVNKIATFLPHYLFIFIPRNISEIEGVEFRSNVRVLSHLNCYQILRHVDYHLTVFSTCGIESLYLGVPTLFINYKNLSRYYYGDYLEERNGIVKYINSDIEFIKTVSEWEKLKIEKELISSYVSDFFVSDRKNRLLKEISNLKIVNN